MTDDLAARLLAAIEETEDDAKAAVAAPGVDQWMWDGYLYEGDGGAWSGLDPLARNGQRIAVHIARQDPHATLIRCAADRKIVAEYHDALTRRKEHHGDLASAGALLTMVKVVKIVAEGYGLSTEVVDDA